MSDLWEGAAITVDIQQVDIFLYNNSNIMQSMHANEQLTEE